MNVLLINYDADPPFFGGTTTITRVLAEGLLEKGCNVSLGYTDSFAHPSIFFSKKILLSADNLLEIEHFFRENKIDIVINQMRPLAVPVIELIKRMKVKYVYAYHSRPMYIRYYRHRDVIVELKNAKGFVETIKKIGKFILLDYLTKRNQRNRFRLDYESSDLYILLSKRYEPLLWGIIGEYPNPHIRTLGNPVVYNDFATTCDLQMKGKEVVVVTRLSIEKRLLHILDIWKSVMGLCGYSDWHLRIVGDGDLKQALREKIENESICNVSLEGRCDPRPFYKRASIFLMTSDFEGWPMTLMECQQYGVVPIVYDSFEACHDIIENGSNGFIVKNNDSEDFKEKLLLLMDNVHLRLSMGYNAIHFAMSSTKDRYVDEFYNILLQVV